MNRSEYAANEALAATRLPRTTWATPAPKRAPVRRSLFARLFGI